MNTKSRLFRGLTTIFAFILVFAITAALLMEQYSSALDENTGTISSAVVINDDEDGDWTYGTQYSSVADAVADMKEFAIREAAESFVLLKNENSALPLSGSKPKVTLFGIRSYAAYYGSTGGGSLPDKNIVDDGNTIITAFEDAFELNHEMLEAYENYFDGMTWGSSGFGAQAPVYPDTVSTTDPMEITLSELANENPDYNTAYDEYNIGIVVLGRTSGESVSFYPGEDGLADGVTTDTGNILGISAAEQAIIDEATDNCDTVIVLINSSSQMEIEGLVNNDKIDAIMWIGYPGVYGFEAVASVLKGEVSPSGHLGDTFAVNSAVSPAMQNYGTETAWTNASSYGSNDNVNSYLVEAEGIYTGYRYYETRYFDIVTGGSVSGDTAAATASAGTYVNYNESAGTYTAATTAGTWSYNNEVSYSFGYGLSYTTFEYEFESLTISSDYTTAVATVKVTNTGDVAGKAVVQLYAQAPYTAYDKANGVEKSAIQLLDYEKTETLDPGASETVTLNLDLSNLASYDYNNAETYIIEEGDYYFTVGESSHDALNNILTYMGYDADDGIVTEDGTEYTKTAAYIEDNNLVVEWSGVDGDRNGVDSDTFSTSVTGTEITNQLTEGDSAMDANYWLDNGINSTYDEIVYLSRSNWDGTFPETYSGFSIDTSSRLNEVMTNDFISLEETNSMTDTTVDELVYGVDNGLTFADMKGVDFDDEKWTLLVQQMSISEILYFMQTAFHAIAEIPSIDFDGYNADDGPGGSDSHTMAEASKQGVAMEDADGEYSAYGTRVAPAPINLAYTWNKELAYENGEIILGESTLLYNLPIMIGPGMNIHRTAYNGRNVEYYSEDPILSGFTGSAVVQGAQSKGCLVNIKHLGFNDQEANRSGVAAFLNEQAARELELRNMQQAFTSMGRSSKMDDEIEAGATDNVYAAEGALGVMTSYNRIGAAASSANEGVMVNILREEWGFVGYNVTDFTGVTMKAAPKESILYGTTAFCGLSVSGVSYWDADTLSKYPAMVEALQEDMHYALYALAQSYAMDLSVNTYTVYYTTWYQVLYISVITISAVLAVASLTGYVVFSVKKDRRIKQ